MSNFKSWVVRARDSIRAAAHGWKQRLTAYGHNTNSLLRASEPWVLVVAVLATGTLLILGGLTVIAAQVYHALMSDSNIPIQTHAAKATEFPATEAFFVVVALAVMLLGVVLLRDLKPYNARPWLSWWMGVLAIFLIVTSLIVVLYITWQSVT